MGKFASDSTPGPAQGKQGTSAPGSSPARGTHLRDECRKPRLLLVDHDTTTIDMFTGAFESAKMELTLAESGRTALRMATSVPLDLLLIELFLPDMRGLEVVRELQAAEVNTPFMVLSASVTVPTVVEAMRLGALTVLEKPLGTDDLVAAVQSFLPRAESMRGRATARASPPGQRAALSPAELDRMPGGNAGGFRSTAERWATFVARMIGSSSDPKTLSAWARAANVSRSALAECCRLVHVSPHDARDFARFLRAICKSGESWQPEAVIDVADTRTLRKLLERAGLARVIEVPTIEEFFERQRWIPPTNPGLAALRAMLNVTGHDGRW